MIFEFSSWSLLGPILDQFWLHFGSQKPTKSVPRGLQSRSKKWSKNLLSLGSIFKWFLVIFVPKRDSFFAAERFPKSPKSKLWAQNVIQAFRAGSQALKILKNSLLESILDQFWVHFGSQNPRKSLPRGVQSRFCEDASKIVKVFCFMWEPDAWLNDTMHASIMISCMIRESSCTK